MARWHSFISKKLFLKKVEVISNLPVNGEEAISRFIVSRYYFNNQTGNISPQAFKPASPKPPERPDQQTSVYRTKSLNDAEIWAVGDDFVATKRNIPILARADIQAEKIFNQDLEIIPDTRPHPRHANIVKWPENDEARQMKCLLLSKQATLLARSTP
jgi:hypothetical protein